MISQSIKPVQNYLYAQFCQNDFANKTSFVVSIFSISSYILKKRLSFTPGTPEMFDMTTRDYAHRSRWIWYLAHIYLCRYSLRDGSQYASEIGVFIFAKRDAVIMQKGRHTKRPCCYHRLKIVSVSSPPVPFYFPLWKNTRCHCVKLKMHHHALGS